MLHKPNHSKSIHKVLQQLKECVAKIKVNNGTWLDDLLDKLSLAPWRKKIFKIGMYILIVIIIILVTVPCLLQCMRRVIDKAIKGVFLVKGEGGDIGIQNARYPQNIGPVNQSWKNISLVTSGHALNTCNKNSHFLSKIRKINHTF